MPTIVKRVALGANTSASALLNDQYEYLPFDAQVEIGITADATGVLATIYSGSDLLSDEGPVAIRAINIPPLYPDDFWHNDVAAAGDRLKVNVRDTSGAARVVMVVVRITPI